MTKVLIHFGPPKTGTSAIQQWLLTHRQQLLKSGVFYPDHSIDENGVSSGNVRAVFDIQADNFTFNRKRFETLKQKATNASAHTLLLSSEFFMRRLDTIADNVSEAHFIGFVRFPLDTIESNYNQGVKRKFTSEKFQPSVAPRATTLDIMQGLIGSIGMERFTLLPFEPSLFQQGNIVTTFLQQVGIDGASPSTVVKVNSSYCFEALEVKRWFNRFKMERLQRPLDSFLQGYEHGTSRFSLIAPDDYQAIKSHLLNRTRDFLNHVPCKDHLAFMQALQAAPQKPYMPQRLSEDVFAAMMRHWLSVRGDAHGLLKYFLETAQPIDEIDKQRFVVIQQLCAAHQHHASSQSVPQLVANRLNWISNTRLFTRLKNLSKSRKR